MLFSTPYMVLDYRNSDGFKATIYIVVYFGNAFILIIHIFDAKTNKFSGSVIDSED